MEDAILHVDLLAFENGSEQQRKAVVDEVTRSLATGFVYVDHDLSSQMLDDVYGALGEFFAHDTDEKMKSHAPGTFGQTGYTGLLVETAAGATLADWKEMINWKPALPEEHPLRRTYPYQYTEPVLPEQTVPGIRQLLLDFHRSLQDIQVRFLRIIALGLGCAEDFFDEMTKDGPTLSRAIRYPAMQDAPDDGHVWADAHGDINLITALPRATARGLQVDYQGEWIDASPPDGAMIINTGMMLERLTNGVIPSGIHRVVAEPGQNGDRISIVQFCHPTGWTVLSPIPTCVTDEHPLRWNAVTADAALQQVLWDINLKG